MATQFAHKQTDLGATETTETDLGEITVPEGARVITGICGAIALQTGTAADGAAAWLRMSYAKSGDIDGVPLAITCMEELGGAYMPVFTPVNLPVTPLSKIKLFATMTLAQGGTCTALICLRFE